MKPQRASEIYKILQGMEEYSISIGGNKYEVNTTGPWEHWRYFLNRILPCAWAFDCVLVTGLVQPNTKYLIVYGDVRNQIKDIYDAHNTCGTVNIYLFEIND